LPTLPLLLLLLPLPAFFGKIENITLNAGSPRSSFHFFSDSTALHCACQNGHLSVVEALLAAKSDVNAKCR
jgi:ankyrin repeat protein